MIDVSKYQGTIDWARVKSHPIDSAYIKCGGSDDGLYPDVKFERNWHESALNGISRGAYFFWSDNYSAKDQLDYMVGILSKYDSGEYKIALDAEYGNSKLDIFLEFVDAVEGYYGYKPVIYTANWWWSKGKTLRDVSSYPLWVASYTSKPIIPFGWQNCAIWQYTSNGKVNGITENTVDMNNIYDLDSIKLKVGGGTMATDYTKRRTATVTGFDYANVRYSTSQTSSLLRRINKGQQVVVNSGNPINGYVPISLRGVANSQEANNLNIAPELPAFVYESLLTYNQETLPVPPVPNPVTPPNPDPTPNPVPTPTPVDPPKQQTPLQKYGEIGRAHV